MIRLALAMALMIVTLMSVAQAQSAIPADPAFGNYTPEPRYQMRHSASFYLPMRDGVRLAVRVDRPSIAGKPVNVRLPVLIQFGLSIDERPRTDDRARGFPEVPLLTHHGYVVIQVARRGNGQSFGARRGYHERAEAYDAFEVIEWAARQSWSNGKVGTYGCSNTGDAALQAATTRPPHLKAVFAGCFNWDKYDGMLRGGILAQWGTGPSRTVEQDMTATPVDGDTDRSLLRAAAQEHQLSPPLLTMWREMPYRDSWSSLVAGRFWTETSLRSYAEQIRLSGIALYLQTGWLNESRDQSFITWANIPGARLIVGPWMHCLNDEFDLLSEIHRFFDAELKGIDNGLRRQPPIRYLLMHAAPGTQWRSATAWPVPEARRKTMFLGADTLLETPADGRPAGFASRPGDKLDCPQETGGPLLQPCALPDIGRHFIAAPANDNQAIVGAPVADLWIRADARDADLFLFLEDVAPDGRVTQITEGRLRASLRRVHPQPYAMDPATPWHRAYAEDAEPLTPGQPARLQIALTPTAYVLRGGHRLQLSVRGGDFRERDPVRTQVEIDILSEAAMRSQLTVPVIAGDTAKSRST